MNILQTLLLSCIPAIVTAIIGFITSKLQLNSEINKLKMSNKHEIEKLLEQHKINIDAIREQHKLELEAKEKDHAHKLDLMQKEHENQIIRNEKENESSVKYAAMGNFMDNALGNVFNTAFQSDEFKDAINEKMKQAFTNR